MLNSKFPSSISSERHDCNSCRNGDWIIYTCPECDYILRENWRTGEMQVRNANPHIQHFGGYFPEEYKDAFENIN